MLIGSPLIQTTGGSSGQTINATILCQLSIIPIKSDCNYVVISSAVREGRPNQAGGQVRTSGSPIAAKPYRGQGVSASQTPDSGTDHW
jgi:hypothetical protein